MTTTTGRAGAAGVRIYPQRLRTWRVAARLSQGELGRRLVPARTHPAVSDIERGVTRLTVDLVIQWATVCAVPAEDALAALVREQGDWIAYGPGFSGDYLTREEAEAVVRANGAGAVYRRVED